MMSVDPVYKEALMPLRCTTREARSRLVENPLSVQLLSGAFISGVGIHLTRAGDTVVAIKADDA